MTFLYADASVPVPSDPDLQAAYKQDKELKHYQITSLDEVKMIDLAEYKRYLTVFLTLMFDEFETIMDKPIMLMLAQIGKTEFKQEEVEFTGFLAAIIAIKEMPVDRRAAALPEALFEAFSELSDPRYVMLIFESNDLGQNDDPKPHALSYSKINKTGVEVPEMDFRSINGYNSMYLWTLLLRNYFDFYSVIIDKMFKSVKITFEEFMKRYNEWSLQKSKEAKEAIPIDNDYKMAEWIELGKLRRLYLRPFEKLGIDEISNTPIYKEGQRDSETAIFE